MLHLTNKHKLFEQMEIFLQINLFIQLKHCTQMKFLFYSILFYLILFYSIHTSEDLNSVGYCKYTAFSENFYFCFASSCHSSILKCFRILLKSGIKKHIEVVPIYLGLFPPIFDWSEKKVPTLIPQDTEASSC